MTTPEPDIAAQLAAMTATVGAMARQMKAFERRVEKKVDDVAAKVETVSEDVGKTKDIVEAWNAVKTGGKFLKWLGGIVAAVTAIIIAVKAGAAHLWGK